MTTTTLEQINSAIGSLTDVTSDKQLHIQIVETAKKLFDADMGKLLLYEQGLLKKMYYSDERVKITSLTSKKEFNKKLATYEILSLTTQDIRKFQAKYFPEEVKFLVVVPLTHLQQQLGFLFLYYEKETKALTAEEKELLKLYSRIAVLTLAKTVLQDESARALEIRDRFISLASHELRTPLTSIHGYIQLLYTRMQKEETVEARWMKELFVESTRMTQLVKELLDVNRIKQGQFAFVFSEVTMLEVVKNAIERHKVTNASHPFEFHCKLSDHDTKVVGDFDKLVEMTTGLLENAVKFSKPGKKIIITLKANNTVISLLVKDSGKGISKQDLSTIFNGFYKTERQGYIEGMGVGLLLAKHIVENHRGKLKIRSKVDKGTSVTVSLPTIKAKN